MTYGQCCGLWIEGGAPAPDAHALMRSRYTAFVLERDAYLLHTWHPSTRPASIGFEVGVKWLGLEVRKFTPPPASDPTQAQVEFVARQRPAGGAAVRLHERSAFVLEDGCWFYRTGVVAGT
jgi:SEC-C motif-containing protein